MLIGSEFFWTEDVWEWLSPTSALSYFTFHFVVSNGRPCQPCHVEVSAKD